MSVRVGFSTGVVYILEVVGTDRGEAVYRVVGEEFDPQGSNNWEGKETHRVVPPAPPPPLTDHAIMVNERFAETALGRKMLMNESQIQ